MFNIIFHMKNIIKTFSKLFPFSTTHAFKKIKKQVYINAKETQCHKCLSIDNNIG